MDKIKIGQFIATRRKETGITQKGMAEKIGVTNKAVSKWETGEGYPDITLLPLISKLLGITVDELLQGEITDTSDNTETVDTLKIVFSKFMIWSNVSGIFLSISVMIFLLSNWLSVSIIRYRIGIVLAIISFVLWIICFNWISLKIDGKSEISKEITKFQKIIDSRVSVYIWGWSFIAGNSLTWFLMATNLGINAFFQSVFDIVKRIPFGRTLFYVIYFLIVTFLIKQIMAKVIKKFTDVEEVVKFGKH